MTIYTELLRGGGRLSVRFSALFGAMLVVFAVVFAMFNTLSASRSLNEEVERHAAYFGRFAADLVDDDLQRLDIKSLHTTMREFATRPDIVYARLLDRYRRSVSDGVAATPTFAAVSRDELFDIVERERAAKIRSEHGVLHVAYPVFMNGDLIGVVRFGVSLEKIDSEYSALLRRNVFIVGAFLLLALPLLAVFTRQVIGPIRRLTDTSRRIADGDLQATIDTRGHGEIGELATSMARMVSSLSRSADEIRTLTFVDAVTGLPNRAQVEARVCAAVEDACAGQTSVVMAIVNIDRFGRLNQALGQSRGDQLLKIVAERLETLAQEWRATAALKDGQAFEVVVGRMSGDEYAMVLVGALDDEDIGNVLRRVRRTFDLPCRIDDAPVDVSVSIGLARSPQDARDAASLERNARIALHAAKAEANGAHRFFSTELDDRAHRRLSLEVDLRRAVARGELDVYFQAQVSCADGSCHGAEALVRWKHPIHGFVPPSEFIAIAEESDLIIEIGRFVLRRVCAQGAHWAARGLKPLLSVNVSRAQFLKPDFAAQVLDTLIETGMDPCHLELEVTETVAMGDPDTIAAMIAPLRAAGVRLAIDDFGVGYSSLSVLTRLPFDVLKIDRSFISEIDTAGDERRVVVTTMLAMARGLGLEVVAEGIETQAERDWLREAGCGYGQGYLFSKPIPAGDFEPWYIANRPKQARDLQRRLAEMMSLRQGEAA